MFTYLLTAVGKILRTTAASLLRTRRGDVCTRRFHNTSPEESRAIQVKSEEFNYLSGWVTRPVSGVISLTCIGYLPPLRDLFPKLGVGGAGGGEGGGRRETSMATLNVC